MKLLTKEITKKMRENADNPDAAHVPALKLFNPCGAATWLLTELDEDGDTAYGLCDLGFGTPELGYVSISELAAMKLPFGLRIERDLYFHPKKTLAEYAAEAQESRRIAA